MQWLLSCFWFRLWFSNSSLQDRTCLKKLGFGLASLGSDPARCSGPDGRCPAHTPHTSSHSLPHSVTFTHRVTGAPTALLRTPTGPTPSRTSVPAQPRAVLALEIDHTRAARGVLREKPLGWGLWRDCGLTSRRQPVKRAYGKSLKCGSVLELLFAPTALPLPVCRGDCAPRTERWALPSGRVTGPPRPETVRLLVAPACPGTFSGLHELGQVLVPGQVRPCGGPGPAS